MESDTRTAEGPSMDLAIQIPADSNEGSQDAIRQIRAEFPNSDLDLTAKNLDGQAAVNALVEVSKTGIPHLAAILIALARLTRVTIMKDGMRITVPSWKTNVLVPILETLLRGERPPTQ